MSDAQVSISRTGPQTGPRTGLNWPEGAFALRLMLAAMLAFATSEVLRPGHGSSAVFSALIVVRPYQQGALKSGLYRLLATAVGIAMAFVAVGLRRSGLNDYALLAIALGPLSLLVAYDSSYRTAMISALLMLSAPVAKVPELDVALARAVVVAIGAVIGIAVSIIILPQSHNRVAAAKALKALRMMMAQLKDSLAGQIDLRRAEKNERQTRKILLEMSQVARDRTPGKSEEDDSARIVGLTRHVQALSLLLRSQWRRQDLAPTDRAARESLCDQLQAFVASLEKAARDGKADPTTPEALRDLFRAIEALSPVDEAPEGWMLSSVARDLAALARLVTFASS